MYIYSPTTGRICHKDNLFGCSIWRSAKISSVFIFLLAVEASTAQKIVFSHILPAREKVMFDSNIRAARNNY